MTALPITIEVLSIVICDRVLSKVNEIEQYAPLFFWQVIMLLDIVSSLMFVFSGVQSKSESKTIFWS